jgi:hypothetical protein
MLSGPLKLHGACLVGKLDAASPSMLQQSADSGSFGAHQGRLGETGPLSQEVQARRKALRIRYTDGMEVRKKRPRGFKKRPRGFK